MRKWLKYSSIILGVLVLVVLVAASPTLFINDWMGKRAVGPEALWLDVDGLRFRDLNKNGELDFYEDRRQPISRRIDDLIAQMTVAEKVGLMFQPPLTFDEDGKMLERMNVSVGYGTYDVINRRLINHFNVMGSAPVNTMAAWHNQIQKLAERTRLGVPITLSTDPRHSLRHGDRATSVRTQGFSLWPEPIGFGAIGDGAVAEEFGRIANEEYRSVGIRMALHPMADLATEPRWARTVGTFGEDAELSSRLVAGYIRGFQGTTIGTDSVLTMTKHFPGGGPQAGGLDAHQFYGADQAYPGDNFEYHLIPFEAAFEAGTAQIMPYYGIPNGQTSEDVAMAFNKDIITGLLRERYGFEGVVCTDWGIISDKGGPGFIAMRARAWGLEGLSVADRFAKALDAGVDQFGGEEVPGTLIELVENGKVSEGRIDRSVRRILKDKFRLGLFDNPYVDAERASEVAGQPDFVKAGKLAQRKSLVLLKNAAVRDGTALPLARDLKIYVEGIDPVVAGQYAQVVANLEDADFAILRLQAPYDPPRTDLYLGENIIETILHQGDLNFKGEELAHIETVMQTVPTVISIYMERPAVIPEIAAQAAGVIAEFGAEDDALLDVIFGDFNPSGHLPFELPRSMAAVKEQYEDVPYDSKDPLFAFGFGLSYPR
ncbi:MAG: glycoside hydrolase family 3 C-terminal domain-containing protein [Halioglobus sp.]|nr:glycoside hydrolase family 3 C-terminal domain-containing protein [Halioglobus sp.]